MVNDVVHLLGCELVQNRNSYRSIRKRSNKRHRPVGTVASGKSYFVAFHHTAVFKKDVQLFNFASHIFILQRLSLVISKRV